MALRLRSRLRSVFLGTLIEVLLGAGILTEDENQITSESGLRLVAE